MSWATLSNDINSDASQADIFAKFAQLEAVIEQLNTELFQHPLITYLLHKAITEMLGLACLRVYESADQAQHVKHALFELVEVHYGDAPDLLYHQWRDLLVLLDEAISQQSASLPHIEYVTLPSTLPALVLSYRLYGHNNKEDDLLTRNQVEHPLILPFDTALEVLSE